MLSFTWLDYSNVSTRSNAIVLYGAFGCLGCPISSRYEKTIFSKIFDILSYWRTGNCCPGSGSRSSMHRGYYSKNITTIRFVIPF